MIRVTQRFFLVQLKERVHTVTIDVSIVLILIISHFVFESG